MSATDTQQPEHYESLWIEDGTIVLQAEQILFKVHRSALTRQSEFFKDMFSLVQDAHNDEGTEARPLLVPDVSAAGLAVVLKMIYQVWGTQLDLENDAFIGALRAAHRLQFPAVLQAAVATLNSRLTDAQKLRLGMECDIDEWQQQAFEDLVLSFQDVPLVSHLGETICTRILRARTRLIEARLSFCHNCIKTSSYLVCVHKVTALLRAIPSTPHSQLLDQYSKYHATFNLSWGKCQCTRDPTDGVLAAIVSEENERRIVAAVWTSDECPQ